MALGLLAVSLEGAKIAILCVIAIVERKKKQTQKSSVGAVLGCPRSLCQPAWLLNEIIF